MYPTKSFINRLNKLGIYFYRIETESFFEMCLILSYFERFQQLSRHVVYDLYECGSSIDFIFTIIRIRAHIYIATNQRLYNFVKQKVLEDVMLKSTISFGKDGCHEFAREIGRNAFRAFIDFLVTFFNNAVNLFLRDIATPIRLN